MIRTFALGLELRRSEWLADGEERLVGTIDESFSTRCELGGIWAVGWTCLLALLLVKGLCGCIAS